MYPITFIQNTDYTPTAVKANNVCVVYRTSATEMRGIIEM